MNRRSFLRAALAPMALLGVQATMASLVRAASIVLRPGANLALGLNRTVYLRAGTYTVSKAAT